MSRKNLLAAYLHCRQDTENIAAKLSAEDQLLQSMPDSSPCKWHRAHTSWFFDEFILSHPTFSQFSKYRRPNPIYGILFNSYYESVGPRHPRPSRGLLSRPAHHEIADYRQAVDDGITQLLHNIPEELLIQLSPLLNLGIAHEEQHQELILTDILHAFYQNPIFPSYLAPTIHRASPNREKDSERIAARFIEFSGGLTTQGISTNEKHLFHFDNEAPQHKFWLEAFQLAEFPLSFGELREFIENDGYNRADLWLSEGMTWVRSEAIRHPLYYRPTDHGWERFGYAGWESCRDEDIVSHLSFFEANAIASFFNARLPTEQEWEYASLNSPIVGNFRDIEILKARSLHAPDAELNTAPISAQRLFGDVWEWTSSPYSAYPGYKPVPGAVGISDGIVDEPHRSPERRRIITYSGFVRPSAAC